MDTLNSSRWENDSIGHEYWLFVSSAPLFRPLVFKRRARLAAFVLFLVEVRARVRPLVA